MHVFIFYGALTFDIMTVNHTLEGFFDGFYLFGRGGLGLFVSSLVDVAAVLVLAGVALLRRPQVRRPAQSLRDDSGRLGPDLRVHRPGHAELPLFRDIGRGPPSGDGPALVPRPFPRGPFRGRSARRGARRAFPISPGGCTSSSSSDSSPTCRIRNTSICSPDRSTSSSAGTRPAARSPRSTSRIPRRSASDRATDLSWKDSLDAFACMECGRCQDACPAFASGKPLSPKMILVNLEKHLLENDGAIIARKADDLAPLVPGTFTEGEIWTCTTCGACMHVCPVEIEHIPKIVGFRQVRVLMESAFPPGAHGLLPEHRDELQSLGDRVLEEGRLDGGPGRPAAQGPAGRRILFWVGCMGSFDDEGKKIARATAAIMKAAGTGFRHPRDRGEMLRRLGPPAGERISLPDPGPGEPGDLPEVRRPEDRNHLPTRLSTPSRTSTRSLVDPHGRGPGRGKGRAQVDRGRLPRRAHRRPAQDRAHSSSGPGRRTARPSPFTTLATSAVTTESSIRRGTFLPGLWERGPEELSNAREHSFCCGAGGGLMWTEESLGRRINHLRTDEVIAVGSRPGRRRLPVLPDDAQGRAQGQGPDRYSGQGHRPDRRREPR